MIICDAEVLCGGDAVLRREEMLISGVMPDDLLELFPVDQFAAPGVGAGVYPHIGVPDVLDGSLHIPVRERNHHGIAHRIGGYAL